MLNSQNIRMTRQRRIILDVLRNTDTHPSAEDVYQMVCPYLPHISLGTVYRNLEVLSDLGEIQKLELGGSIKRFDGNPKKHYHIRCMNCGRLDDAPMNFLGDIERELDSSTGYKVIGHRLEFIGLCPECYEKASSRW